MSVSNANKVPYAAPVLGSGSPDGTSEVAMGQIRPGVSLKYNQRLVMYDLCLTSQVAHPYPVPWVQPPLAPGAMNHLISFDTGMPVPVLVPKGYALTVIEKSWNFDQDAEIWLYFDTMLTSNPGMSTAGSCVHISQIVGYSTLLLDPTAAAPHLLDVQVFNRGVNNMEGGISFVCILEAIGTPPFPTRKDALCPFCHNTNNVVMATNWIKCATCGHDYFVGNIDGRRK